MTDRPILFSGPMVRALLAGRKTQTRRVLKAQPRAGARYTGIHYASDEPDSWFFNTPHGSQKVRVAYDEGDRLWVREAWRTGLAYDDLSPSEMGGDEQVLFEADGVTERWSRNSSEPGRLRAGMHMPRWASRLTLIVTDVRVQRLQEITNEDCIAEGIPVHPNENAPRVGPVIDDFGRKNDLISHYGAGYRRLWDSLNAARGFSWQTNPWIVAVTFAVERRNIDARAT